MNRGQQHHKEFPCRISEPQVTNAGEDNNCNSNSNNAISGVSQRTGPSKESRANLWPPSHVELMAGVVRRSSEKTTRSTAAAVAAAAAAGTFATAGTIPAWYRGSIQDLEHSDSDHGLEKGEGGGAAKRWRDPFEQQHREHGTAIKVLDLGDVDDDDDAFVRGIKTTPKRPRSHRARHEQENRTSSRQPQQQQQQPRRWGGGGDAGEAAAPSLRDKPVGAELRAGSGLDWLDEGGTATPAAVTRDPSEQQRRRRQERRVDHQLQHTTQLRQGESEGAPNRRGSSRIQGVFSLAVRKGSIPFAAGNVYPAEKDAYDSEEESEMTRPMLGDGSHHRRRRHRRRSSISSISSDASKPRGAEDDEKSMSPRSRKMTTSSIGTQSMASPGLSAAATVGHLNLSGRTLMMASSAAAPAPVRPLDGRTNAGTSDGRGNGWHPSLNHYPNLSACTLAGFDSAAASAPFKSFETETSAGTSACRSPPWRSSVGGLPTISAPTLTGDPTAVAAATAAPFDSLDSAFSDGFCFTEGDDDGHRRSGSVERIRASSGKNRLDDSEAGKRKLRMPMTPRHRRRTISPEKADTAAALTTSCYQTTPARAVWAGTASSNNAFRNAAADDDGHDDGNAVTATTAPRRRQSTGSISTPDLDDGFGGGMRAWGVGLSDNTIRGDVTLSSSTMSAFLRKGDRGGNLPGKETWATSTAPPAAATAAFPAACDAGVGADTPAATRAALPRPSSTTQGKPQHWEGLGRATQPASNEILASSTADVVAPTAVKGSINSTRRYWSYPLGRAGGPLPASKIKEVIGAPRRWHLGINCDSASRRIGPRRSEVGTLAVQPATTLPGTGGDESVSNAITVPTLTRAGAPSEVGSGPGPGPGGSDASAGGRELSSEGTKQPHQQQVPCPVVWQKPTGSNTEGILGQAAVMAGRSDFGHDSVGGGTEEVVWSDGGKPCRHAVPSAGDEAQTPVIAWPGARRKTPSLLKRVVFVACDPGAAYFRTHLLLWLAATALLVADRLLWNLWPRQDVLPSLRGSCGDVGGDGGSRGAGGYGCDFFCDMDEAPGCLMEGPNSVKVFDFVVRATGRIIMATTNLVLAASCRGTWRYLSQTKLLHEFLGGWASDNDLLRRIGLWTMGLAVCLHAYAILLPASDGEFENEIVLPKGVEWPAQLTTAKPVGSRIDVEDKTVTWVPDDLVGLSWLSAVLISSVWVCARHVFAARKRARLGDQLNGEGGGGGGGGGSRDFSPHWRSIKALAITAVVVESFRRRDHPHVWFLNGPFLLWFAVDRLCCMFRCSNATRSKDVVRVSIDRDYDLVFWKSDGSGHDYGKRKALCSSLSSNSSSSSPAAAAAAAGVAGIGDITTLLLEAIGGRSYKAGERMTGLLETEVVSFSSTLVSLPENGFLDTVAAPAAAAAAGSTSGPCQDVTMMTTEGGGNMNGGEDRPMMATRTTAARKGEGMVAAAAAEGEEKSVTTSRNTGTKASKPPRTPAVVASVPGVQPSPADSHRCPDNRARDHFGVCRLFPGPSGSVTGTPSSIIDGASVGKRGGVGGSFGNRDSKQVSSRHDLSLVGGGVSPGGEVAGATHAQVFHGAAAPSSRYAKDVSFRWRSGGGGVCQRGGDEEEIQGGRRVANSGTLFCAGAQADRGGKTAALAAGSLGNKGKDGKKPPLRENNAVLMPRRAATPAASSSIPMSRPRSSRALRLAQQHSGKSRSNRVRAGPSGGSWPAVDPQLQVSARSPAPTPPFRHMSGRPISYSPLVFPTAQRRESWGGQRRRGRGTGGGVASPALASLTRPFATTAAGTVAMDGTGWNGDDRDDSSAGWFSVTGARSARMMGSRSRTSSEKIWVSSSATAVNRENGCIPWNDRGSEEAPGGNGRMRRGGDRGGSGETVWVGGLSVQGVRNNVHDFYGGALSETHRVGDDEKKEKEDVEGQGSELFGVAGAGTGSGAAAAAAAASTTFASAPLRLLAKAAASSFSSSSSGPSSLSSALPSLLSFRSAGDESWTPALPQKSHFFPAATTEPSAGKGWRWTSTESKVRSNSGSGRGSTSSSSSGCPDIAECSYGSDPSSNGVDAPGPFDTKTANSSSTNIQAPRFATLEPTHRNSPAVPTGVIGNGAPGAFSPLVTTQTLQQQQQQRQRRKQSRSPLMMAENVRMTLVMVEAAADADHVVVTMAAPVAAVGVASNDALAANQHTRPVKFEEEEEKTTCMSLPRYLSTIAVQRQRSKSPASSSSQSSGGERARSVSRPEVPLEFSDATDHTSALTPLPACARTDPSGGTGVASPAPAAGAMVTPTNPVLSRAVMPPAAIEPMARLPTMVKVGRTTPPRTGGHSRSPVAGLEETDPSSPFSHTPAVSISSTTATAVPSRSFDASALFAREDDDDDEVRGEESATGVGESGRREGGTAFFFTAPAGYDRVAVVSARAVSVAGSSLVPAGAGTSLDDLETGRARAAGRDGAARGVNGSGIFSGGGGGGGDGGEDDDTPPSRGSAGVSPPPPDRFSNGTASGVSPRETFSWCQEKSHQHEAKQAVAAMRGPFRTTLSDLKAFPDLPPLLIVGTGAGGAALVLEFIAHAATAAAAGKVSACPATVVYTCDSPALLLFVTNELLTRKMRIRDGGVRVVTGLSSRCCSSEETPKEERCRELPRQRLRRRQAISCCCCAGQRRTPGKSPTPGRLDLQEFVENAPAGARVYFCGEARFDPPLRAACGRMCLRYRAVYAD